MAAAAGARRLARPVSTLPDPISQKSAEALATSEVFRFDASDLMPASVGAGTFWSGMIDWVAANGENTEEVFQAIEDSWPS